MNTYASAYTSYRLDKKYIAIIISVLLHIILILLSYYYLPKPAEGEFGDSNNPFGSKNNQSVNQQNINLPRTKSIPAKVSYVSNNKNNLNNTNAANLPNISAQQLKALVNNVKNNPQQDDSVIDIPKDLDINDIIHPILDDNADNTPDSEENTQDNTEESAPLEPEPRKESILSQDDSLVQDNRQEFTLDNNYFQSIEEILQDIKPAESSNTVLNNNIIDNSTVEQPKIEKIEDNKRSNIKEEIKSENYNIQAPIINEFNTKIIEKNKTNNNLASGSESFKNDALPHTIAKEENNNKREAYTLSSNNLQNTNMQSSKPSTKTSVPTTIQTGRRRRRRKSNITGAQLLRAFQNNFRSTYITHEESSNRSSLKNNKAHQQKFVRQVENDFIYGQYCRRIANAICQAAKCYTKYVHSPANINKRLKIDLVLDKNGNISPIPPEQLTGIDTVDKRISDFLMSATYPRIPKALDLEVFKIAITIEVNLKEGNNLIEIHYRD